MIHFGIIIRTEEVFLCRKDIEKKEICICNSDPQKYHGEQSFVNKYRLFSHRHMYTVPVVGILAKHVKR